MRKSAPPTTKVGMIELTEIIDEPESELEIESLIMNKG